MSNVTKLHDAVKRGDLGSIKALLEENRDLANSRSETDARGTYPLHVAAEFGQPGAARALLKYGADVSLLDWRTRLSPLVGRRSSAVLKLWRSCSKPGPSRANATSTALHRSAAPWEGRREDGSSFPTRR